MRPLPLASFLVVTCLTVENMTFFFFLTSSRRPSPQSREQHRDFRNLVCSLLSPQDQDGPATEDAFGAYCGVNGWFSPEHSGSESVSVCPCVRVWIQGEEHFLSR